MRPAAQLQSAIELLDEILVAARDNGPSADALASKYFAARRYAGSKDRRRVRDLAWAAIRRFGERPANARAAFVALADNDPELAALFDGSGYGPAVIDPMEPRASGAVIPNWVQPYFAPLIDVGEQSALLDRAPLDLRVNTLKSDRSIVLDELAEVGAETLAALPDALRLPTGSSVENLPALREGRADIQDLGSQIIAAFCDAKPGMTVLDLCAGAGGKTLALASHMQGQGQLIASDTNRQRLGQIASRKSRSGADFIETLLLNPGREAQMLSELRGACDVVLVDAPCSGSGTWRRNPETRWRLTPERLNQVMLAQENLLGIASEMVTKGGHLVYAVCSLFDAEGRDQVAQFLQSNTNWRVDEAVNNVGRVNGHGVLLSPYHDGTDGFFMARLQKL